MARSLNVPVNFFYEGMGEVSGDRDSEIAPPPLIKFISSGDRLQLALAFMKIKEVTVRRRVLDLVKSLFGELKKTDG